MDDNFKGKPLKGRRKVQLAHIIMGDSITEASKVAGYATVQSGSRALKDTRRRLRDVMDYYGLTEEVLVRDYMMPLMNATSMHFFAKDGIVMDERTTEDNAIRRSALDMVWKLRGAYPKEEPQQNNLNITINNANTVNDNE